MDELLTAGPPVTFGGLVLIVEEQQDLISDLEAQRADLALQVSALSRSAGGAR